MSEKKQGLKIDTEQVKCNFKQCSDGNGDVLKNADGVGYYEHRWQTTEKHQTWPLDQKKIFWSFRCRVIYVHCRGNKTATTLNT